ncbi:hypothetical protein [Sulfurimonas sp.]|uniref:hypothetical protein n=1 Tax=Sulfurimonas sp. TaxID=2022749 RepID=UPI002B49117D|nr:hypothetical protein [Sulfurimonas sp.]
MKIIFLVTFLLLSSLSSDYLYNQENRCVQSYYVKGGNLYYLRSGELSWRVTTEKNSVSMSNGYIFNPTTKKCFPDNISKVKEFINVSIGVIITILIIWSLT